MVNQDVSKDSIARWIKLSIVRSYQGLTDRDISFMKVRSHEVRAISSSLAYSRNVPLLDIMRAAYWHSHTTFSSFYLRSLSRQMDEVLALGPLVAAQSVVR